MKKRITALLTALVLLCSLALPASAAYFSDVPASHWAYEAINAMAAGGLLNGYGNGKFGPSDPVTISQMATIIGNIKGNNASSGNSYWAYDNIDYCVNTLKCLPSQGAITQANYDVPCSRELAIYMLMEGVGVKQVTLTQVLNSSQIPDFDSIDSAYCKAVLKAYQKGVIQGKDASHTFGPQDSVTRAEVATIFYRAGWVTAANENTNTTEDLTVPAGTKSTAEIIAEVKKMSGVTWKESTKDGESYLTATDEKYGGLYIEYDDEGLGIIMPEYLGMDLSYDSNGKVISSFSYESRQFVKKLLQIMYPTEYENAYLALKDVMLGNAYETSSMDPKALRWYDGRMLGIAFGTRLVTITVGEVGDRETYDYSKSKPVSTAHSNPQYVDGIGSAYTEYDLDKW